MEMFLDLAQNEYDFRFINIGSEDFLIEIVKHNSNHNIENKIQFIGSFTDVIEKQINF